MSDVRALQVDAAPTRPQPKRIMRPCDYTLLMAVNALETQVGTVEAYNKLCDAAALLKTKVDAGDAHKPADMWLIDPNFIYPAE